MKFLGAWPVVWTLPVRVARLAADKVTFGTNWLAEAEHGGYYQAVADGTYAEYGLDVAIVQGGPQANGELLLAAGRLTSTWAAISCWPLTQSTATSRSSSSPRISKKIRR